MLRLPLLALAVSLSACSASAPVTPGAALPSVPASADAIAVAQPVAPTGDARLDAFLASLAAAVDRHDWRGVAEMTAPESFGIALQTARTPSDTPRDAAARGLAQMLGLGEIAAGSEPFDRLDALRVITLRSAAAMSDLPGVAYSIEGDFRFADGETVASTFLVGSLGDGYAVVLPAASGSTR